MSAAVAIPGPCRNCDAPLGEPVPHYCPQCGQDTSPHPPSFREFLHEFVGHYVALEGKLWRTLLKLFFLPGELTREYLRGRKQRYVLPLRLYLTASFLFFLLVKVIGADTNFVTSSVDGKPVSGAEAIAQVEKQLAAQKEALPPGSEDAKTLAAVAQAVGNAGRIAEDRKQGKSTPAGELLLHPCDSASAACGKINARLKEKFQGMTTTQVVDHIKTRAASFAPYAVFLLLPIYAGMMQFAYHRRRMYYGEHVVFALHLHTFLFFLLLLGSTAPASIKPLLDTAMLLYGLIAMQRVYGGRWWANLLRYAAVGTAYLLLILIVALAVMMGAVFL